MPKRVYNNVVDHRLKFGDFTVEDITSVGLPTISHPTSTYDVSGMTGAIDIPNQFKVEAMELTINHNGGVNSEVLIEPGAHEIEFRVARQVFNAEQIVVGVSSSKYRLTVLHKSTTDGTVEAGNPRGSTETYSVERYQKIDDGKEIFDINIATGKNIINGVSYSDPFKRLLD